MSKQSALAMMANAAAKKIVAEQTRVRLVIGFDAALIAAHEVLKLGPGRAAAFANAYHEALDDLATLYLEDSKDKQMEYGKGKRDQVIRKILGDANFVPYEKMYGDTYVDEFNRIRVLMEEQKK
ncbi:MAG: hypothetical protein IKF16_11940 [Lachnospiraceae bacterium]|nr:hypothetical protein [Lachnospiraceae bacterium]